MFKNAIKLDQRIAVYVPATDNVNQAVNNDAMVKKCAAMLSAFFGGATIQESRGAWIVTRETYKKPGKVAKDLGLDTIYNTYETDYLIDLLSALPKKSWKGMAPKDENDWGITLEECIAAAREAREPVNDRKRKDYEAYYRAYCD